MGLLDFLRYLRLKFLISSLRLLVRLLVPPPAPKPDSVLRIPSRDKGRTIKIHVYNPRGGVGSAGREPHPVLINCFGGGFAMQYHGADDGFCRYIATHTNHVVLDVQYRVAPEDPFPAAVNDAEDAAKYVLGHSDEYQTAHVSLCGFSSGGTLALVTSTLFAHGTFQSLIGFYPSPSMAGDPSERKAPVPGRARRAFWTKLFREAYIRDKDPRDPRISPAFADTTNFPQEILIFTADHDISATGMEALAEKIKTEGKAGGRNVVVRRMENCDHGFDKLKKHEHQMEAGREAYSQAVDLLKRLESES
ncbi:putative carboxylesterase [Hyaloscypha variabilis F]|uniref:Putative carboxylesterase n=1 Tax=Hyaloscypha variabilis (strain UAMH 11265 / GT02V1 / F) TaxID=1149755 RepID=A0A2J6SE40_HYAVF|nr:putative carboxylesterase [Hyaloscypha variabilis F]